MQATDLLKLSRTNMISIIKSLFFDRAFVNTLKQTRVHNSYLHNLLLEGKITLQEYLEARSESEQKEGLS